MTTVPVSLITSALQSHPFVQVANFLKNDRVESLLLGSLPSQRLSASGCGELSGRGEPCSFAGTNVQKKKDTVTAMSL